MTKPSAIDQVAQDILADMPLKKKAAIAKLDKDSIPYIHYAFDICVFGRLGKDNKMRKEVMHRIWEVLRETHRLRCVK